jgi:hypothetical protein
MTSHSTRAASAARYGNDYVSDGAGHVRVGSMIDHELLAHLMAEYENAPPLPVSPEQVARVREHFGTIDPSRGRGQQS